MRLRRYLTGLVLGFFGLALPACVGPLVAHESARTVGAGNNEFQLGYGRAGALIKYTHGFSRKFDAAIDFETLSTDLRFKYAWVQGDHQGWSFASAAGAGFTFGGKNYYLDTVASYLGGAWEPYADWRMVLVTVDPIEAQDRKTEQVNFTIPGWHYDYAQAILGVRYNFHPRWVLSAEISDFIALTGGVRLSSAVLVGAAVALRF